MSGKESPKLNILASPDELALATSLTQEEERVINSCSIPPEFFVSPNSLSGTQLVLPFPPGHLIHDYIVNYPSPDAPPGFRLAEVLFILSLCSYDRFYFQTGDVGVSGKAPKLRSNLLITLLGYSGKGKSFIFSGVKSFSETLANMPRLPTQAEKDSGEPDPSKVPSNPDEIPLDLPLLRDLGDFTVASAREDIHECRRVFSIKDELGPFFSYTRAREGFKSDIPPFIMQAYSGTLSRVRRAGNKHFEAEGSSLNMFGATTPSSLLQKLEITDLTDGFCLRWLWFLPTPGLGVKLNVGRNIGLITNDPSRHDTILKIGDRLYTMFKTWSKWALNTKGVEAAFTTTGIRMFPSPEANAAYDQLHGWLENSRPEGIVTEEDFHALTSMDIKLLEHTLKLAMLITQCRVTILDEVQTVINYRILNPNWERSEQQSRDIPPESYITIDSDSMGYAIDLVKNYFRPNAIELYLAIKTLKHSGLIQTIKQVIKGSHITTNNGRHVLKEQYLMNSLAHLLPDKYQPRATKEAINHMIEDLKCLQVFNPLSRSPDRILVLNNDHTNNKEA